MTSEDPRLAQLSALWGEGARNRALQQPQPCPNFRDDFRRRFVDIDYDRAFRIFQCLQLTREHFFRHEMSMPLPQSLPQQLWGRPQIDQNHFLRDPQFLPIDALQCRTSQHCIVSRLNPGANHGTQSFQPRGTVGVGERNSVPHLLHIRGGMVVIRVHELPSQLRSQQSPDRRLPCPGNSHQHNNHTSPMFQYSARNFTRAE